MNKIIINDLKGFGEVAQNIGRIIQDLEDVGIKSARAHGKGLSDTLAGREDAEFVQIDAQIPEVVDTGFRDIFSKRQTKLERTVQEILDQLTAKGYDITRESVTADDTSFEDFRDQATIHFNVHGVGIKLDLQDANQLEWKEVTKLLKKQDLTLDQIAIARSGQGLSLFQTFDDVRGLSALDDSKVRRVVFGETDSIMDVPDGLNAYFSGRLERGFKEIDFTHDKTGTAKPLHDWALAAATKLSHELRKEPDYEGYSKGYGHDRVQEVTEEEIYDRAAALLPHNDSFIEAYEMG